MAKGKDTENNQISAIAELSIEAVHDESFVTACEEVEEKIKNGTESISTKIVVRSFPILASVSEEELSVGNIESKLKTTLLIFASGFPDEWEAMEAIGERVVEETKGIPMAATFVSEVWTIFLEDYKTNEEAEEALKKFMLSPSDVSEGFKGEAVMVTTFSGTNISFRAYQINRDPKTNNMVISGVVDLGKDEAREASRGSKQAYAFMKGASMAARRLANNHFGWNPEEGD